MPSWVMIVIPILAVGLFIVVGAIAYFKSLSEKKDSKEVDSDSEKTNSLEHGRALEQSLQSAPKQLAQNNQSLPKTDNVNISKSSQQWQPNQTLVTPATKINPIVNSSSNSIAGVSKENALKPEHSGLEATDIGKLLESFGGGSNNKGNEILPSKEINNQPSKIDLNAINTQKTEQQMMRI